jgi:hypothetical protein
MTSTYKGIALQSPETSYLAYGTLLGFSVLSTSQSLSHFLPGGGEGVGTGFSLCLYLPTQGPLLIAERAWTAWLSRTQSVDLEYKRPAIPHLPTCTPNPRQVLMHPDNA